VRIAVNQGGHLERVARRLFPGARIRAVTPNHAVRDALLAGEADAAVSDTLEAPVWLEGTTGLRVLGPFTRDWKAWWLPAEAAERARDVDRWLLASEADGTLARLRASMLPGTQHATATPLTALAAAIEERLALMPLVAEAKRASGAPVRAPEQEGRVLAAAPEPTRVLFAALIDAAREIQEATLAAPPALSGASALDLDGALRPALARIGERIAELALRLPAELDAETARAALQPIELPGFGASTRDRIASALVAVAGRASRRQALRSRPPRCRSRSSRDRAGCSSPRALRDAPPAPG
jgi:cyclohexadienyl dehydratase